MATFKGQEGIWRTSETGVHYFIPNGVDPAQAWEEWSKNRHYLQYWKANERDKYGLQSFSGINKKEYDKLISSGGEGRIDDYLDNRYDYHIPEDIEEKMSNALNKITSIENKRDFFAQLVHNLANENSYNGSNWTIVKDAFEPEIKAKYNELIQPVLQKIDSIDIDNSYESFERGLFKSKDLPEEFKNKMKQNFDSCKDEDCKIMAAIMTDIFGLEYTNREGGREWSYCNHEGSSINLLGRHNDTETLFHETFHAIFERYKVRDSGLKEIMKKEMRKSKKVNEIFSYFEDAYSVENGLPPKNELTNQKEELETKINKLYNEVLNKAVANHGNVKTAEAISEAHKDLSDNYPEYIEMKHEFWQLANQISSIENGATNTLAFIYPNLNDMISAATWNKRGSGHTGNYWANDEWNQANEFFAEMAAMKATGDTKQYELVKKFAPESTKKFEEIFSNIIKNRKEPLEL